MIKKGDKKGSHIEIIISFIIFITFLIFIFSVVQPSLDSQKGKENVINDIESGVINLASSDIKIITVKLENGGANCVELTNFISSLEIGNNIIIKDDLNNKIISNYNSNSIEINRINPADTFFKIYYSNEFNELETSSACPTINYELGLTKTEKYVFESKIIELIGEYSNYNIMRDKLKTPKGVGFGYGIKLSNGTILETITENLSTNIYIKETPVKYVDSEGNILIGFIRTKIW